MYDLSDGSDVLSISLYLTVSAHVQYPIAYFYLTEKVNEIHFLHNSKILEISSADTEKCYAESQNFGLTSQDSKLFEMSRAKFCEVSCSVRIVLICGHQYKLRHLKCKDLDAVKCHAKLDNFML